MNGGTIPDPLMVKKMSKRNLKFTNDLTRMTSKNFMYTGDNWNTESGLRHRMANRSPDE